MSSFARYIPFVRSILIPLTFATVFLSGFVYAGNALWVGESAGILKVATADGRILFEINHPGYIEAMAVEGRGEKLWVFADGHLRAYRVDGVKTMDVAVPTGGVIQGMAVSQNRVWLAKGSLLYLVDKQGQVIHTYDHQYYIDAHTLDVSSETAWLYGGDYLSAVDANGNRSANFKLHLFQLGLNEMDLSYDYSINKIWLAVGAGIYRYNLQGEQVFSDFLSFEVKKISPDGQGGLWFAGDTVLSHFTVTGAQGVELTPYATEPSNRIIAITADKNNQSVWLANDNTLRQYDLTGALQKSFVPDLGDGKIRHLRQLHVHDGAIREPKISILSPVSGAYLLSQRPQFELSIDSEAKIDLAGFTATDNGLPIAISCTANDTSASCQPDINLVQGLHDFTISAKNIDGDLSNTASVNFTIDSVLPVINLQQPSTDVITNVAQLQISGTVNEALQSLNLSHNGVVQTLSVTPNNYFTTTITLVEGSNALEITAIDLAGNLSHVVRSAVLDTVAPATPVKNLIQVSEPVNGQVTVTGSHNSVEPGAKVIITNTTTGKQVVVYADGKGKFTASIAADLGQTLTIRVEDAAGNQSKSIDLPLSNPLPPDPVTVAPPLSATSSTDYVDQVNFLYSGANPIQKGVQPNDMQAYRVAVIRGRVLGRDNQPLTGVTISIQDHTEFGWTLSRADGMFDMAVNGGGLLVVDYQREGYLPVQRQVQTPWKDYVTTDDIVMIPLDNKVTSIDLNQPGIKVAQGNPVTDTDGTRTATILFPENTTAEMVLPNGTRQALTTLNVRATEYTVGDNGPQAMPGELPPTSGYTYAVEFSVDEAIAAGADSVEFSQPVPFYVDNFLSFPVGVNVPVGYYNRKAAAWEAIEDSRVLKVLSINTAGLAEIDLTGDGVAADAASLSEWGITDAERLTIANQFAVGKTLWRGRTEHFSPIDCNTPIYMPDDAKNPTDGNADSDHDKKSEPGCTQSGCIIEVETQTLGEEIEVAGSEHRFVYRSGRNKGIKSGHKLKIRLSGAEIPLSLKVMALHVQIAGKSFYSSYTPEVNKIVEFEWDGKDGYGRELIGIHPGRVEIGYGYVASVGAPLLGTTAQLRNFSRYSALNLFQDTRGKVILWTPYDIKLGRALPASAKIGNWGLDQHHDYDLVDKTLYKGNGEIGSAEGTSFSPRVETLAGNYRQSGYAGDGGSAEDARFRFIRDLALTPDGGYYIADSFNSRIRYVSADGIVTTVAGTGTVGYSGDGGPATQAMLNQPAGLALASDGSLFFTDYLSEVIRRIDTNGIITTIAGRPSVTGPGGNGNTGDGGLARDATFGTPTGLIIAPDGTLYVNSGSTIRRISPDGMIETILSNQGTQTVPQTGRIPASEAAIIPQSMTLGKNGDLYVSGSHKIFRVGVDGLVEVYAGNGSGVSNINPIPADGLAAKSNPLAQNIFIHMDEHGILYVASYNNLGVPNTHTLRVVTPDRLMYTYIGRRIDETSRYQYRKTTLPSNMYITASGIDVSPEGEIYLAEGAAISRLSVPRDLVGGEIGVSSKDATEMYIFNFGGRHQRTLDTLTRAVKYAFAYDAENNLTSITDGDGNTTIIERDASGKATALVSPYGQRTELIVDGAGHLYSVSNPLGETHIMTYSTLGLMTKYENPKKLVSDYTFDLQGLLEKDLQANLGGWTLAREDRTSGKTVTITSTEGRATKYALDLVGDGDLQRTITQPDGSSSSQVFAKNGKDYSELANGTKLQQERSPDFRFGMRAPVNTKTIVETPSGLTANLVGERSVGLSDPKDLLSITSYSETTKKNTRAYTSRFNPTTSIWTHTTPQNRSSTVKVDSQQRPLTHTVTGLTPMDYAYDTNGRLETMISGTGVEQRSTRLAYYATGVQKGYLQSITDPLDRKVEFKYDLAGRVTEQLLPNNRQINYTYDANGNLESLKPPGRPAHIFNYNVVDQAENYIPPALSGVLDPKTVYEYNLDKQLTKITRPGGQRLDFTYKPISGQLDYMTLPVGRYSYAYLASSGQLNGIVAPGNETLAYEYDGFLPTKTTWTGSVNGNVRYVYNNDFNVESQSINAANTIIFDYDNDELLTKAGNFNLTRYAQHGLVETTSINTIEQTLNYTGFAELENDKTIVNDGTTTNLLYETNYIRDKLGRITDKTETIAGVTTNYHYDYDLAGRLEHVFANGVLTDSYDYDTNGNRLTTTQNGVSISATYDDQDRLINYGQFTYRYSDNGELQQKTNTSSTNVSQYDYDVLGNLRKVTLPNTSAPDTVIDYVIDGQNRRIGKKVDGVLVQGFLYQDQLNPIAELNADGSIKSQFIYADKINVPAYMTQAGIHYRIVSDHLGSPRLVVNTLTGAVAQRLDYDVWGNVILDTNPGFQPFAFAGGIYDQHSKLTRFGARDYDAMTGRWTSKDPIRFNGGDANLFGYVLNDPINFYDPEGESVRGWAQIILTAVAIWTGGPDGSSGVDDIKGRREPTKSQEAAADRNRTTPRNAPQQQLPPKSPVPNNRTPGTGAVAGIPGWLRLTSFVGLMLYPSELGCADFDCNKNGIDDRIESGYGFCYY